MEAQRRLGIALLEGFWELQLPKDPEEALRRLREAAEQGDREAMYRLGVELSVKAHAGEERGGVPNDAPHGSDPMKAAVDWLERAAEEGHPDGQYTLGAHLLAGEGVARDVEQAAG